MGGPGSGRKKGVGKSKSKVYSKTNTVHKYIKGNQVNAIRESMRKDKKGK